MAIQPIRKINVKERTDTKRKFPSYQGSNGLEDAWYDACIEELGEQCDSFGYNLEDFSNELAGALTGVVINIAVLDEIAQQEMFWCESIS